LSIQIGTISNVSYLQHSCLAMNISAIGWNFLLKKRTCELIRVFENKAELNRIYNVFNWDRENQNYSSAHHWILQDCKKFSFTKEKHYFI